MSGFTKGFGKSANGPHWQPNAPAPERLRHYGNARATLAEHGRLVALSGESNWRPMKTKLTTATAAAEHAALLWRVADEQSWTWGGGEQLGLGAGDELVVTAPPQRTSTGLWRIKLQRRFAGRDVLHEGVAMLLSPDGTIRWMLAFVTPTTAESAAPTSAKSTNDDEEVFWWPLADEDGPFLLPARREGGNLVAMDGTVLEDHAMSASFSWVVAGFPEDPLNPGTILTSSCTGGVASGSTAYCPGIPALADGFCCPGACQNGIANVCDAVASQIVEVDSVAQKMATLKVQLDVLHIDTLFDSDNSSDSTLPILIETPRPEEFTGDCVEPPDSANCAEAASLRYSSTPLQCGADLFFAPALIRLSEAAVTSRDVLAHELGHVGQWGLGISYPADGLTLFGQSAALHESMADYISLVTDDDWMIGEDTGTNGTDGCARYRNACRPDCSAVDAGGYTEPDEECFDGPAGPAPACTVGQPSHFRDYTLKPGATLGGAGHFNTGILNLQHFLLGSSASHPAGPYTIQGQGRAAMAESLSEYMIVASNLLGTALGTGRWNFDGYRAAVEASILANSNAAAIGEDILNSLDAVGLWRNEGSVDLAGVDRVASLNLDDQTLHLFSWDGYRKLTYSACDTGTGTLSCTGQVALDEDTLDPCDPENGALDQQMCHPPAGAPAAVDLGGGLGVVVYPSASGQLAAMPFEAQAGPFSTFSLPDSPMGELPLGISIGAARDPNAGTTYETQVAIAYLCADGCECGAATGTAAAPIVCVRDAAGTFKHPLATPDITNMPASSGLCSVYPGGFFDDPPASPWDNCALSRAMAPALVYTNGVLVALWLSRDNTMTAPRTRLFYASRPDPNAPTTWTTPAPWVTKGDLPTGPNDIPLWTHMPFAVAVLPGGEAGPFGEEAERTYVQYSPTGGGATMPTVELDEEENEPALPANLSRAFAFASAVVRIPVSGAPELSANSMGVPQNANHAESLQGQSTFDSDLNVAAGGFAGFRGRTWALIRTPTATMSVTGPAYTPSPHVIPGYGNVLVRSVGWR